MINADAVNNVAIGINALIENTTGNNNTAIGYDALRKNTTGSNNTAIGSGVLSENTTDSNLVAIGGSTSEKIILTAKGRYYIFDGEDIEIKLEGEGPSFKIISNIRDLYSKFEKQEERLSQLETAFLYRPEGALAAQIGSEWNVEKKKKIVEETKINQN